MGKRNVSEYDDIRLYLIEAGRFKLLSRVEEQFLSRAYREGDEDSGKQLIEANLRLVVNVARKFQGRGLPLADLIQAGNEGLLRAARKFDPDRGYRFTTYAMWWITQGIRRSIHSGARLVVLPAYACDIASESYRAGISLTQDLGREPSLEEVREHDLSPLRKKNVKVKQHERIIAAARGTGTVSLDQTIQGEQGDDSEGMGSLLAAAEVKPEDSATFLREELASLIKRLKHRARFVITRRYGIDGADPWTLQEVAKHLGISRERVRQIEELALSLLRKSKNSALWQRGEYKVTAPADSKWPRGWTRCSRCRCATHKGPCKDGVVPPPVKRAPKRCKKCWYAKCRCVIP